MSSRAAQREETRARIVAAALECFAERGFHGASTREIARQAGTNQGLITYHFRSKDELWRAAVDRIFGLLRASLSERDSGEVAADPRERVRERIREYVRFAAGQPALFRLMVSVGQSDDARMRWLVDTHLRPLYEAIPAGEGLDPALKPHAFYALAGAGSVIFAVAEECRRLAGIDPGATDAVERHADFVARLLVP